VSFILASASPRRSEILTMIGIPFEVDAPRVDENLKASHPTELPRLLAEAKAKEVSLRRKDMWALAFDTLVFLDERPLGKPQDADDAFKMLSALSGREHEVITGVALARNGMIEESEEERTKVFFRKLKPKEISDYIATNEPFDKAGAYGIQGIGARLVDSVEGCFYNVVGLPIALTLDILQSVKEA
jgi:septum formation protein